MLATALGAALLVGCEPAGPNRPVVIGEGSGEVSAAEAAVGDTSAPAMLEVAAPQRPGQDWPLFLGPRETGIADETELMVDWGEGPPVAWSRELGTGYAAPSILGNRCLVFHRLGDREILECLTADAGETLWARERPSNFRDPYGYNNGPRCTPQIAHGPLLAEGESPYVITFGATGRLMRTDLASGEASWEVMTNDDYEVPPHFFGVGCTPVLERTGDRTLVLTLVGGQPNAGIVAFDAADGSVAWEAVGRDTWDGVTTRRSRGREGRPYEWSGDEMVVTYSSPIVATIHGQRHLLAVMRQGLVSVDPADGRVRWAYWFRSPIHESVTASRPVVEGDTILISAPYDAGCVRLQVAEDGESVSQLWRTDGTFETHFATAIPHEGHYYGFHGRHEGGAKFTCIDAATGQVKWTTTGFDDPSSLSRDDRGRYVDGSGQVVAWPFFGRGSAILAGDKFLLLGERGTLAWARATPKSYDELARFGVPDISYPSWPAPVLSRGRVYLRDEDSLVCLDLSPTPETPLSQRDAGQSQPDDGSLWTAPATEQSSSPSAEDIAARMAQAERASRGLVEERPEMNDAE